ncbi:MAG: hypothetical protein J6A01_09870 [Proteobacteria bacterium]|nr:hypothetical protein [Pseudomonadota bacterium]
MKKFWLPLCCMALFGMGCQQNIQHPSAGVELPVSRVVMYQSGIGYVERAATVSGNELVLRIRPDQINDILKSLTVIDRGKGSPVSISLPVDRDTLDSLAQIPEQVRSGGIRALLGAFRGANVKIKTRNGTYEGRIVGIDEPTRISELSITEEQKDLTKVTIKTNNDVLEVLSLADIKSVTLYDKGLADGLDKSLNISLNEGNWKQLELRIRMDSDKKRELAMSYLVAMPTWKPAYRLVLTDNEKGILQGWAVISNVSGADWNNISFSLVSGQPMSFTYDLYTPQFLARPDLSGLAAQRAAAPEVVASAYGANREAPMPAAAPMAKESMRAAQKSKAAGGRAANSMMMDMAAEAAMDEEAEYEYKDSMDDVEAGYAVPQAITTSEMANSFTELASKAQIGSFDVYETKSKLTIPDGSTALVNIINEDMSARDTRLIKADGIYGFDGFYKGWKTSKSFQTIELKNSNGSALDSGPITIYRDSAVIGEGYLSRTESNAMAYITFANEGRISVAVVDQNSTQNYRLDSIQNGRCAYTVEQTMTNNFEVDSHIGNDTTALIQMQKFPGWNAVNFPQDTADTSEHFIIPVLAKANAKTPMALTMKRDFPNSRPMARGGADLSECQQAIQTALQNNQIPAELAENFRQFNEDAQTLDTINVKLNSLQTRRNEIQQDQNSLSQTLAGLKDIKTSNADSLRNQLMARQKSNEQTLVEITGELYELQVKKGEIELRMKEYARTLEYVRQG